MAKFNRREKLEKRRNTRDSVVTEEIHDPRAIVRRNTDPLVAKTESQKKYLAAIRSVPLTFGIGPAGTGKTYVAGAAAAEALMKGDIDKIVITRPAVDAGESLGYLPGTLEEKYAVYIQPFRDVLDERLGKAFVDNLIKNGKIEGAPLAFMRGRTFKHTFVILDEAQNTTPTQMKLFLTRIGEDCHVIVNGDETQKDIPGPSGLMDGVDRCFHIPSVRVIKFKKSDIVRSGLVQEIVSCYESATAPKRHASLEL